VNSFHGMKSSVRIPVFN